MTRKKTTKPDKLLEEQQSEKQTNAENHKRESKSFLFFLILLFVTIYVSILYKSQIYQEFNNLKLIPQNEKFTELFFEDNDHLPRESAKNAQMSFAFTIGNSEGTDRNYTYNVYLKNDFGITLIDTNTVFINKNDRKTIRESYTFPDSYPQEILYVDLPDKNQEIHFLLKNNNP